MVHTGAWMEWVGWSGSLANKTEKKKGQTPPLQPTQTNKKHTKVRLPRPVHRKIYLAPIHQKIKRYQAHP